MALVLLLCRQVAVLAALAAIAWAVGTLASRALWRGRSVAGTNGSDVGPVIAWPLVPVIGLAVIAQGLLLLGMAGWLRAPILLPLALGLLIAAVVDSPGTGMWRPTSRFRGRPAGQAVPVDGPALERSRAAPSVVSAEWSMTRRVAVIVFAALMASSLLLTLYPPVGFDQTMYHLPFARAFAASGGVPVLPTLRYPVFPQLAELLNAAILLVADDVATQVTGWLAFALCTGLVCIWARERSSPSPSPSSAVASSASAASATAGGWLAAAIFAGSPIAAYLSATGYVDPLLALFGTAALYAASRAGRTHDAGSASRTGWIVAAALLAGTAASVKYLGLYFVLAAALFLIDRRRPWRTTIRDLAIYGIVAFLAMAPTYGRLIVVTGNPVFPFHAWLFGATTWAQNPLLDKPPLEHLRSAATLLWDITFRRHAVGHQPFFSPAFVLGLPIALLAAWRDRTFRLPLLIALAYVLFPPAYAHYVLTIAPFFAIIIGSSCAMVIGGRFSAGEWNERGRAKWGERALVAGALLLALGGEAYVLHRLHRLGPPPTTEAERGRWLAQQLPLYPAVAFLSETTGGASGRRTPGVRIYGFDAERMVDYVNGTLLGDHNGPVSYARIAARVREGGSLSDTLAQIGASYLLVATSASPAPADAAAAATAAAVRRFWIDEAANDPFLERIYSDAHATVYRVTSVGGPGSTPADD